MIEAGKGVASTPSYDFQRLQHDDTNWTNVSNVHEFTAATRTPPNFELATLSSWQVVIYCCLVSFGVLSNAMNLTVLRKLKTSVMYIYLKWIAFFEMCFAAFLAPGIAMLRLGCTRSYAFLWLNAYVLQSAAFTFASASMLLTVVIGYDRVYHIKRPIHARAIITKVYARVIVALVFVAALALRVPFLVHVDVRAHTFVQVDRQEDVSAALSTTAFAPVTSWLQTSDSNVLNDRFDPSSSGTVVSDNVYNNVEEDCHSDGAVNVTVYWTALRGGGTAKSFTVSIFAVAVVLDYFSPASLAVCSVIIIYSMRAIGIQRRRLMAERYHKVISAVQSDDRSHSQQCKSDAHISDKRTAGVFSSSVKTVPMTTATAWRAGGSLHEERLMTVLITMSVSSILCNVPVTVIRLLWPPISQHFLLKNITNFLFIASHTVSVFVYTTTDRAYWRTLISLLRLRSARPALMTPAAAVTVATATTIASLNAQRGWQSARGTPNDAAHLYVSNQTSAEWPTLQSDSSSVHVYMNHSIDE